MRWGLLLAALVGITGLAQALELPERPQGAVNDYAGALSSEARARLEAQLHQYTAGKTHQIVVAIFPSLDGEVLEDVSIRLAEQWRIGSRADDGVLLTVFLRERRLRIEVGYGLEARLTDARSARIIREQIAPRFRAGDIEGGLRAGLAAIDSVVTGNVHAEDETFPSPARQRPQLGGDREAGLILAGFLGVALLIFFIFLAAWRSGRGRRRPGGPRGGVYPWFGGSSGSSGGSSSGGSGSSGGSFGGGGGSFGGGGSSGSW